MKKSTVGAAALFIVGLLFIGVLLLADNLLRGARIDLTADNLRTLSDGTKNIVRNLKEPVNLYFFYSQRVGQTRPQIQNHAKRVQELLEELVARSGGNLTLKVIDPQPFTEDEERATELGIPSEQVNAEGDRLYLGLAATNSTDGKDAIPLLDPKLDEQLEYDVAKLIHRVSTTKKPVVGWLSSLPMQGDFDMQSGRPRPPWAVYGQIEQMYTLRTLEPALTSIDKDIDVLVIVHPKTLSPAALYAIDQYAMRGGHILAFVDPNAQADHSAADPNNPMAAMSVDKSSRLDTLLASWGVDFNANQVIVDLERGLTVQVSQDQPPLQHIAILGFDASSMAKDVITAQLDSVNMVTVGSLKPVAGSKLKFEPLVRTSKQAGPLPTERFVGLQDAESLRDGFKPTGEFVVAARISGEATSAYAAGPPEGVTAASDALKASAKPLNVIVFADSDLLSDVWWTMPRNFFGQTVMQPIANNGELVWNAIDNLSGSADLISIRGRATYSRPFDRVEALRRDANARFRNKEQQLTEELARTKERLNSLRTSQPGSSEPILSPAQFAEIERFTQEQERVSKELRNVRAQLNEDIENLGTWVTLVNTLLVPLLVAIVGLLVAYWRRRRRHAIAMLRSQGVAFVSRQKLLVLAGATTLLLAAGIWMSMHRAERQSSGGGDMVFADLKAAVGEVTEIRMSKGDGSRLTLRKAEHDWLVVERNYAADPARVRELLLGLAGMKVVENKTRDPANYAKLGVEPTSPTATSTLVEVIVGKKTWSLLAGKGSGGNAMYVRKPDATASALASPSIVADTDHKRWLDRLIADIPGGHIHDVSITPAGGAAYTLSRASRGTALEMSPVPKGRAPLDANAMATQAETVSSLLFDEVRPLPTPAPETTDRATYRTFDGQVLEFAGHRDTAQAKAYITVSVRRDPELAAKFAPAATPPASAVTPQDATNGPAAAAATQSVPAAPQPPPAPTTAAEPKSYEKTVERLAARVTGFEYEVPIYKYEALFKPQEEMLTPLPPKKGAK